MKKYIVFATSYYDFCVECKKNNIPKNQAIQMEHYGITDKVRGYYSRVKNDEIKCIGITKEEYLEMYEQGFFI